mgnify:CR=1 FL=1
MSFKGGIYKDNPKPRIFKSFNKILYTKVKIKMHKKEKKKNVNHISKNTPANGYLYTNRKFASLF